MGVLVLVIVGLIAVATRVVGKTLKEPLLTRVVLVAGVVVGLFVGSWIWFGQLAEEHWATCHITHKDPGSGSQGYRIFTKNCGLLGNRNSLFSLKFDADELWDRIRVGQDARLLIAGGHWSLWTWPPNIIKVADAGRTAAVQRLPSVRGSAGDVLPGAEGDDDGQGDRRGKEREADSARTEGADQRGHPDDQGDGGEQSVSRRAWPRGDRVEAVRLGRLAEVAVAELCYWSNRGAVWPADVSAVPSCQEVVGDAHGVILSPAS